MADKTVFTAVIGTLTAASFTLSGNAEVADELFQAEQLDRGFMAGKANFSEGACGEGTCGEEEDQEDEDQDNPEEDKDEEGRCGEGMCGEGQCGEGACGEGACGGNQHDST